MAGLVPAIHVFGAAVKQDVDARNKCGHDEFSLPVMLREGGASSIHRGDGDYWIVCLRGR
jgi:hypothetical protein